MLKIPPDWGTFALLIVSFLIFWFIFRRLLFVPFLNVLAARESKLKGLSERTEQLLQQSKAAQQQRAVELSAARQQALAARDTQRRAAEEELAHTIEEARLAAKDSVERVRAEIERQLRAAEQQLGKMGEDLAAELAERVLGRKLSGGGPQVHSHN